MQSDLFGSIQFNLTNCLWLSLISIQVLDVLAMTRKQRKHWHLHQLALAWAGLPRFSALLLPAMPTCKQPSLPASKAQDPTAALQHYSIAPATTASKRNLNVTVGCDTVQVEACVRSNRPEDTCDMRNLCRGPMREQKVLHSPRGGGR